MVLVLRVVEGPARGQELASNRGRDVIGRDAARLRLVDRKVSRRQAAVTVRDGRWWLEDLRSRHGTDLNGQAVTGPEPLGVGDRLRMGQHVLEVAMAEVSATVDQPGVPTAGLYLRARWRDRDTGEMRRLPILTQTGGYLGREGDLVLPDSRVSRRHARVWFDGIRWAIEDAGSANGTIVNGQRLSRAAPLSAGDTIVIGRMRIRVKLAAGPAAASAAGALMDDEPAETGADSGETSCDWDGLVGLATTGEASAADGLSSLDGDDPDDEEAVSGVIPEVRVAVGENHAAEVGDLAEAVSVEIEPLTIAGLSSDGAACRTPGDSLLEQLMPAEPEATHVDDDRGFEEAIEALAALSVVQAPEEGDATDILPEQPDDVLLETVAQPPDPPAVGSVATEGGGLAPPPEAALEVGTAPASPPSVPRGPSMGGIAAQPGVDPVAMYLQLIFPHLQNGNRDKATKR